jgi:two-component system chemotaxis response regulator CheB
MGAERKDLAKDNVSRYRLVVIGGSAGSLETILRIVGSLPAGTDAAYIIVVHRKNTGDSILTELVSGRTDLRVREIEDKEPIIPGTVYVAPPDYHLLVENENEFSLDSSEKVQFSRPSIDVTFESVALAFGPAVIVVLLSGANADGADGVIKVMEAGGYSIVQDPHTADMSMMPKQAINRSEVNAILSPSEIGPHIRSLLTRTPRLKSPPEE